MTAAGLSFFVPGKPIAQGSKAFKGIRNGRAVLVEQLKDLGPWRAQVAMTAHNAMHGSTPLPGPITVKLGFVMPRPKSAPKRSTPPAVKRPDLDKCARAILDAITGVILIDDSQVVDLHATKRVAEIGEMPGVNIIVRTELNR